MTLSRRRRTGNTPRGKGDSGTAILEFSLIAVILLTIVFGIINFGLILSFKQDMTRAAAEGARAGAVASPGTDAQPDAEAAISEAVTGFDRSCDDNNDGFVDLVADDTDGLLCKVAVEDCGAMAPYDSDYPFVPLTTVLPSVSGAPQCVTVELVYNYDSNPLLAEMPLIGAFLPDVIHDRSDARING